MSEPLTQQEVNTISYYSHNAHDWASKHAGGNMFDQDMEELFKLVKNGKVLEIGTGQGEDAKKLISYYGVDNYVGIEPAKGLLNLAKNNNPGAEFIEDNIYTMNIPTDYFNVFWVCAMLIHVHKNKLNTALMKVNKALKSGSYGFISIMEGSADMQESRPGRYYSLWSQEEFEEKLIESGFSVYKKRKIVPDNGAPWLAYIVFKR